MHQPPGGWGPPPGPYQGYPPPQSYGQGYGPQYGPGYAPVHVPVGVWTCPFCRANSPPLDRYKVSTGGWVVFGLLLFFCFPFCWLGFLIKEHSRVCAHCGSRVS
jgi:LITAF-like zinc ribbon protein